MSSVGGGRNRPWRNWARDHRGFLFVWVGLVAFRLWFVFAFPVKQISDYSAYYGEAQRLAALGNQPFSAVYSVGPKLLYAVPLWIFGNGPYVIGLTNTLVYALGMIWLYLGVCRLFDARTASLTVVLCTVSFSELYFNNLASSEVLGTFFVTLILLLLSRGLSSWSRVIVLGLVAGLSIYNRSNMLLAGVLVFPSELLLTGRLRGSLAKAVVVQLVALLVTLPLCWFNARHFGRFTPLIANSAALWYGNNPTMLKRDFHFYARIPEELPVGSAARRRLTRQYRAFFPDSQPKLEAHSLGPYEHDDLRRRYAAAWIRSHPRRFLELMWARFVMLFDRCTYGEVPYRRYDPGDPEQTTWQPGHLRLIRAARTPILRWYQVLISLATVGLILTLGLAYTRFSPSSYRLGRACLPALFILHYSLPFIVSTAANRYHIPILCLCWIYLASGLRLTGGLLCRALKHRHQGVA